MGKATLVIMAAGIGSRYGAGVKQLAKVGPSGELIIDYSIYDALEAGFDKVVFIIRKDLEKDFKEVIGDRIAKLVQVEYAFQETENIPEAFKEIFKDRTKPWGTGQAILCCKDLVHEPFVVINADDYYGKEAYREAFRYATEENKGRTTEYAMVGFVLGNTLSDNGAVTRGVCHVTADGMLADIEETKGIIKRDGKAFAPTADGEKALPLDAAVSMNLWALNPEFFTILENGFTEFLASCPADDLKSEYLLPTIIGDLLKEGKASVKVLHSDDRWFGVTYMADKAYVEGEIHALVEASVYPAKLFD